MSRSTVLAPDVLRRVRRDPRFQEALESRIPSQTWRSKGLCLSYDPEVFFPNAAEDPTPALSICGNCAVRGACLAAALDAGECDGVWGGTTPDERRAMRQAWLAPEELAPDELAVAEA